VCEYGVDDDGHRWVVFGDDLTRALKFQLTLVGEFQVNAFGHGLSEGLLGGGFASLPDEQPVDPLRRGTGLRRDHRGGRLGRVEFYAPRGSIAHGRMQSSKSADTSERDSTVQPRVRISSSDGPVFVITKTRRNWSVTNEPQ